MFCYYVDKKGYRKEINIQEKVAGLKDCCNFVD